MGNIDKHPKHQVPNPWVAQNQLGKRWDFPFLVQSYYYGAGGDIAFIQHFPDLQGLQKCSYISQSVLNTALARFAI